jgi:hypothetical protein
LLAATTSRHAPSVAKGNVAYAVITADKLNIPKSERAQIRMKAEVEKERLHIAAQT